MTQRQHPPARQAAASGFQHLRDRLQRWALATVVAVMCSPALAALPTMPTPGTDMNGATCAAGDWMCAMSAYFKAGMAILGLVLVALGFLYVVGGALSKWREYTAGRAQIADLKEYFIMGMILTVFLVILVTYAFQVIGQT
ncbi:TIGR03745 family integrating conjugative element membrane protein [Hydrogenophaga sp. NH-16]|uniref:TIGR03745 family integrating conjugative element membrane protein n=1 Tax=Hydrogenophaga sp. NH-16 TaxID=2184519 RepID=UPI000FD86C8A|nr:TIGR03745 family integrating conjugative element membrane protein [Hydrogenophaga sp. NH-16]